MVRSDKVQEEPSGSFAAGTAETMASTDNIELAVPLFERGFPEDRIEAALKHCKTLAEALAWLDPDSEQPSSSATEAANESAPKPKGLVTRRRHGRKMPARPAEVAPSSDEAQPQAPSTPEKKQPQPPTTEEESAGPETPKHRPQEVAAETPEKGIMPILNQDGSKWWQEAAMRWPAIVSQLRSRLGKVRISIELRTPAKKRPCDGQDMEQPQKRRQSFGRRIASPCFAPPFHLSQAASQALRAPSAAANPPSPDCPKEMKLSALPETCKICCDDTPAWRSVRLACGHGWYCARCVKRHAEARMELGVASITCPECAEVLAERDLRKLLPEDLIERLLERSLEQAVSCASDLWACPTPNCPMRVALEPDAIPRLKCTLCKKESCVKCGRQPYHRGTTCEEFAEKQRAKGRMQEEESLMQWIQETGTKQCPTCRMGVSKQNLKSQHTQYAECHKMICRNCNTRFCFKCLAVLTDKFTCGCSIDAHGFINPLTGKRVNHMKPQPKRKEAVAKRKAR